MGDYQDVFCRVEKKFMPDSGQCAALIKGLSAHGFLMDDFGRHTISNIYYDTADFSLIRHSLDKPVYKEKLRLRCYGTARPDGNAFIEIKKKFKGIVYKRRVGMPLGQAESALERGKLPESCGQIGREIEWFLQFYAPKPRVMIAYDREAFFSPEEEELRVTFDRAIRFRQQPLQLALGAYGEKMICDDQVLMEIKVGRAMPLWLVKLLDETGVRPISFSKYGYAYTNYIMAQMKERNQSA